MKAKKGVRYIWVLPGDKRCDVAHFPGVDIARDQQGAGHQRRRFGPFRDTPGSGGEVLQGAAVMNPAKGKVQV
ncbi:MAG: hypothetical protein AMJ79_05550, partial [Phycisphaerae bacterium SM23_30]